ncbi:MAG: NUDIX domain-containing protein, partial [Pseudomonadota bacterium]
TQKRLRRAARIVLLDPLDRTLLFRFDVESRPPFWVTAGGECDPGESFSDAARRELFEETGIVANPGPEIARIEPEFVTVEGEPVKADERYYFLRVENDAVDTSRHTELEQRLMTRHRWFTLAELADWHEAIYPEILAEIIEENMP